MQAVLESALRSKEKEFGKRGIRMERLSLALERISQIIADEDREWKYGEYFLRNAKFILAVEEVRKRIVEKSFGELSLKEQEALQDELYRELKEENYASSICKPSYMCGRYGEKMGKILALFAYEIRSIIPMAYRALEDEYLSVLELFLEVHTAFRYEKDLDPEEVEKIIYYYAFDYLDITVQRRLKKTLLSSDHFIKKIIMHEDLSNPLYLYKFGDYISDTERGIARYLSGLEKGKLKKMADTLVRGYVQGFVAAKKDLSKKRYVGLWYHLGFEALVKEVIAGLEARGLEAVLFEKPYRLADRSATRNRGCASIGVNRQAEYDHRFDNAILMKKAYTDRRLDMMRSFFEENEKEVSLYAGPALIEVFGEREFNPENDEFAYHYDEKQKKQNLSALNAAALLQSSYIRGEETSFSIIAWPLPEIAKSEEEYAEIFEEIIRLNTLDSEEYSRIQQHIIDALDQAGEVCILGGKNNETKLKIRLQSLKDPQKESLFENCVADVNIPVGEVFTSPRLKGTEGLLHVSRVYIGDIQFKELKLYFKDGMVSDYSCANFKSEEQNRKLIEDMLLKNHPSLPMGEFAIGTNTAAYAAAKKYGILAKYPILIAEKTGPHFAIGDTCYSHEEDYMTYNPDGKAIIARDNEVSALRREDPSKAYFNCHTDITIPYDELGDIYALRENGERIYIIQQGRFVLEGTEALNKEMGE